MADLFDRRKVLLATQSLMLLSAGAMALLTFADALSPVGVLTLTFMLGTGSALTGPAWMAIQPDLVPKAQFAQAVSLSSMTFNVGRAVGPAVGGLIIAAAGPGWVFAINAASFVGTLIVLSSWHPAPRPVSSTPAERFVGATIAGVRYSVNSGLVRTVLARSALLMFPGSAIQALLPVVVRGPLAWGSGGYGILLGCFGVGASVSAALRPRVVRHLHPDALVTTGSLVLAMTLLVQGFASNQFAVGAALLAGGFMWSLSVTATTVAAQAAMPAWVRARGMAVDILVLTGSIAVGSVIWGVTANWNLSGAHLIAACVIGASTLVAVRWPLTWERELDLTLIPGDEPEVVLHPAPTDGPVLVSISYRVRPDQLAEFTETIEYVEGHRRRTGAYQWGLYRDLSDTDRFVETFFVSSWAEHLRQHHRRTAVSDSQLQRLRPYLDGPGIQHLLSTESEGAMALHVDQPPADGARQAVEPVAPGTDAGPTVTPPEPAHDAEV
jgi:MFS family permease